MITIETIPRLGRTLTRLSSESKYAVMLLHGAGLEPTHPFYLSLMEKFDKRATLFAPFTSATHFVGFGKNLRDRKGWANHHPAAVISELQKWFEYISKSYNRVVIAGHSWGGYAASQIDHNIDLCLISAIPSLDNIVLANWPLQAPISVPGGWVETEPGAPFPFLGNDFLQQISGSPQIVNLIRRRKGNTLIIFGEKEHPRIKSWAEELYGLQNVSIENIANQGHFYGCNGSEIAVKFEEWIERL